VPWRLAVAAYFFFVVLPLGVSIATLGELNDTNESSGARPAAGRGPGNMAQGLAMYDAEERIVVANDGYAQLYGIDPQTLRAGTHAARVVEQRIANGAYIGVTADDVLKTNAPAPRRQATEPLDQQAERRASIAAVSGRGAMAAGW